MWVLRWWVGGMMYFSAAELTLQRFNSCLGGSQFFLSERLLAYLFTLMVFSF